MKWRASRASEILEFAYQSELGESLELYRRAALMADAEGDMKSAVSARMSILYDASDLNEDYDMVAAFSWLAKMSKADPDLIDPSSLDWTFKWVVEHLFGVVAVPRRSLERLLDEFERRYAQRGLDSAPAAQLRLMQALVMKDKVAIRERYNAWIKNEKGAGSDCDACIRNVRVAAITAMGDFERALTEAKPILDGTMVCGEIPEVTFPHVIECYLRLGKLEEAKSNCKRGIDTLEHADAVTYVVGTYLVCLAITGQIETAFECLQKWFRGANRVRNERIWFEYHRGASLLCRAARAHDQDSVFLTLPPTFSEFMPDGLYDVASLGEYFDARAEGLATRFDERHGNDGYWEQLRFDRSAIG